MSPFRWLVVVIVASAVGGWLGAAAAPTLARAHPTVQLADRIYAEDTRALVDRTKASEAFRDPNVEDTPRDTAVLFAEAKRIEDAFGWGAAVMGVFFGLVVAGKLWGASRVHRRPVAAIRQSQCVACARCFAACPRERLLWDQTTPPEGT